MGKYTKNYQIKYYDVDARNDLKISNLLDLILEVSNEQTVELGISAADLFKRNLGWVVTQYHLEITRMPKADETIQISTEATGYNKFFSYRDFWIQDEAGNDLIFVQSIWIVMDLQTRQMVRLDQEVGEQTKAPLLQKVPKLPRVKLGELEEPGQVNRVRYYDIDANLHVHNSHYFEWMINQLPIEILNEYQISEIDIKFENEILLHDEPIAKIGFEDLTSGKRTFHLIENAGKKAAEAIFTWK